MSDYRRSREGRTFFFTVVTHERRPILTTEAGRSLLRSAIYEVKEERPFEIVATVLLPDHLHAVWTLPPGDTDYSTRWRRIKSLFTQGWQAEGRSGGRKSESRLKRGEQGIWQRRFYEHTVRDETDLKRCVDHPRQPVEAPPGRTRPRLAVVLIPPLRPAGRIRSRLGQRRHLVRRRIQARRVTP
jgi:putative transposase